MRLRSLLFVPGDRPERFAKAAASGADALILDLEDSVVAERKRLAREAIAAWLADPADVVTFVRVNPLDTAALADDLAALAHLRPAGLVLPKANGAATIRTLVAQVAKAGGVCPPILPIATETASALFQLGSYGEVVAHLAGLTWGAEDLPAAIGASTARESNGAYTAPFAMVRSLALFAAHAAGVAAIETVFPDIADREGLASYVARGRRDGFTGMLAIHPEQIETINRGFSPSEEEIAAARAIVEAFETNPEVGALRLGGRMIDRPHLEQARRLLARAE
ncbi:HpcH/HpaI aldolase/citrate lyase family protein [Sphingomonas sp. TDK1]|uniref:HpcH/HpaI aldolase/citrate lyase family protein n=1 Tax=Sphingomonas sp. TDK1 TaxID=453247 RepID=UPI0007DA1BB2|nr:CoA ester lyase [Sphingomonas sp. TDK1]OAN57602.1 citrate lyase [Sphingomonas sp. TDK1]